MLLSFKAEYTPRVLSSERIVMMSAFHRAKVVWLRLAHIPMGKNEGVLIPLVHLFYFPCFLSNNPEM